MFRVYIPRQVICVSYVGEYWRQLKANGQGPHRGKVLEKNGLNQSLILEKVRWGTIQITRKINFTKMRELNFLLPAPRRAQRRNAGIVQSRMG